MKKRVLLLTAAAAMLAQSVPAMAEDVTLIGGDTANEISVGESVDFGDYEITVSNVEVAQNAGVAVADPAHKYLSFDVTILNWMLEDLTVDPVNSWTVVYNEDYEYSCAVYAPSLVGTWEGTAIIADGTEINYVIEITDQDESGLISGEMYRMADGDSSQVSSSWYVNGYFDSTNGEISLAYGDYILDGNNRASLLGNLQGSVWNATVFWPGGDHDYGDLDLTMNIDSVSENLSYRSVIEPLVEQNYSLNVLLPNEAAEGLTDGALVLNLVIGNDTYTVTLE